ncbi:MAG TPA: hypothetical protein VGH74_14200 [Planctomycetaceae bacterium]
MEDLVRPWHYLDGPGRIRGLGRCSTDERQGVAHWSALVAFGMAAARWLSDKKIVLVGADSWSIEVVPPEDPERPYPVHQWNIVRNGIYQWAPKTGHPERIENRPF